MLWREHGSLENLPTPSTYSGEIDDVDNESYTSPVTAELVDTVIATGMLKLAMSWDFNSEEEAEKLIQKTFKNPWPLDIKIPVVEGGFLENVNFRVSKRKVEMVETEKETSTAKTKWKTSFTLMQKKMTEAQEQAVEEANN